MSRAAPKPLEERLAYARRHGRSCNISPDECVDMALDIGYWRGRGMPRFTADLIVHHAGSRGGRGRRMVLDARDVAAIRPPQEAAE